MAQIHEEVVVIKLSKLVKEGLGNTDAIVTGDVVTAIEQVAQQLVGDAVIVEVQSA